MAASPSGLQGGYFYVINGWEPFATLGRALVTLERVLCTAQELCHRDSDLCEETLSLSPPCPVL